MLTVGFVSLVLGAMEETFHTPKPLAHHEVIDTRSLAEERNV
jgi:hypothetical protein